MASSLKYLKNCLNGNCNVEAKDKQHIMHPTENVILGLPGEPKSQKINTKYKLKINSEKIEKLIKRIMMN